MQGIRTDEKTGTGTQLSNTYAGYDPSNYVDQIGHGYQSDLTLSVAQIHEYFQSIGDADNIDLPQKETDSASVKENPIPDDLITEHEFIMPSCDNCYAKKVDGEFTIVYPDKLQNAIHTAATSYVPFGDSIQSFFHTLFTGNPYLTRNDLDTAIDALALLEYSPEPLLESIGENVNDFNNYYNIYKIADCFFDEGPTINDMTFKLFGDNITSIDSVNWVGISDIIKSTGISTEQLNNYYE